LRISVRNAERDQRPTDAKKLVENGLQAGLGSGQHAVGPRMPSTHTSRTSSSTGRARRPTPAAWPRQVWRCARIDAAALDQEEVDKRLHQIMVTIHKNAYNTAKEYGKARKPRGGPEHRRLCESCRRDAGPGVGVSGKFFTQARPNRPRLFPWGLCRPKRCPRRAQ